MKEGKSKSSKLQISTIITDLQKAVHIQVKSQLLSDGLTVSEILILWMKTKLHLEGS